MQSWKPERELVYWTRHKEQFYLDYIKNKYDYFKVDKVISEFVIKPQIVVDIGGGKYGGALYYYKGEGKKILIDYLADEFKKRFNVFPIGIQAIKADFSFLPLKNENVDIIFAWEVFDHALTEMHLKKGQKEIIRVLKKGGILFFHHISREISTIGHTVLMTSKEILKRFSILEQLSYNERDFISDGILYGKQFYTVLKKC